MRKILIAVSIGSGAGVIDVAPMLIQRLDVYACISAFVFWVVMGIVISYISMPVKGWLKGLIIAELCMMPIGVLIFQSDPEALPIVIGMTALLGSLTGYLSTKYLA